MKTKHAHPLRAIAQIIGVFGIRGEIKIRSFARTADEFNGINSLFLGENENETKPCSILAVRNRGNEIYLKLTGFEDRTSAEEVRGKFLFVEEADRKEPPPEKFYADDLIGCTVKNEHGAQLGSIISVDALPSQMIYTVKTGSGEVIIPAVREFIISVDVGKKEIVVRPPEGLFSGEMLE